MYTKNSLVPPIIIIQFFSFLFSKKILKNIKKSKIMQIFTLNDYIHNTVV